MTNASIDDLYWTQRKATKKSARDLRRERAISALTSAGVPFQEFDHGWQLRIQWKGESIDYLTGADKWSIQGKRSATTGQYWGIHKLIRYLATGDL